MGDAAIQEDSAAGELRKAKQKFESIVSIAADAIISIDANQQITLFNSGAESIFGYRREEVLGQRLDILIPVRFRAAHAAHVEAFATSGIPAMRMGERSAISGLRRNGEEFPAEAAISQFDLEGEKCLTVVLRDVTAQRRAHEEQRVLAQIGEALTSTSEFEGMVAACTRVLAGGPADFCIASFAGKSGAMERISVASSDPAKADLARALKEFSLDRQRRHLELATLSTGKAILLASAAEPVLRTLSQSEEHLELLLRTAPQSIITVPVKAGGTDVVGCLVMIASRRRFDERHLRFAEEIGNRVALGLHNAVLLERSREATRARETLLAVIAHDLRTPLQSIQLGAELALRGLEDESRRRQLEMLLRASSRMNRLVEDLLDAAKMDAGRFSVDTSPLDANGLVTEALEANRHLLGGHRLVRSLDSVGSSVLADRDRLLQVFTNLLTNAAKFTSPGGTISVGSKGHGDHVEFFVSDTGSGISPAELPHLFERFWQGRGGDSRGAGLGLAIAKGIIEAHGGRIWAESGQGPGSTFTFTLLAAPRPRTSVEGPQPHAH